MTTLPYLRNCANEPSPPRARFRCRALAPLLILTVAVPGCMTRGLWGRPGTESLFARGLGRRVVVTDRAGGREVRIPAREDDPAAAGARYLIPFRNFEGDAPGHVELTVADEDASPLRQELATLGGPTPTGGADTPRLELEVWVDRSEPSHLRSGKWRWRVTPFVNRDTDPAQWRTLIPEDACRIDLTLHHPTRVTDFYSVAWRVPVTPVTLAWDAATAPFQALMFIASYR